MVYSVYSTHKTGDDFGMVQMAARVCVLQSISLFLLSSPRPYRLMSPLFWINLPVLVASSHCQASIPSNKIKTS
jgi:hypothetical protein